MLLCLEDSAGGLRRHHDAGSNAVRRCLSARWGRSSALRSRISIRFRPRLIIPDCWSVSRIRLTTSRLVLARRRVSVDEEDVRALKRARAAGHSASELVRKGLRVVASRYYKGRRPPTTRLFGSTDTKLGDESEPFRNLEE